MNTTPPTFWIGSVPIYGDLILAPMDGITDSPFRLSLRRLGSAASVSEFINAMDYSCHHPHLEDRLVFTEEERPFGYQILDCDVDRLVQLASFLLLRRPDFIDVNLGCSAHKVAARGAGAGMLKNPSQIADLFKRLTKILDIPITGKIRLGWDEEHHNYLEIARIIEDNGGKAIAVHGRTRKQMFNGQADWDAIAEVKQAVSIPVIANGDVQSVADIDRIKQVTRCDAVMIGRAAIANPWLFSRRDRNEVTPTEVFSFGKDCLQNLITRYDSKLGLILFRKFASRLIAPYHPDVQIRKELLTETDPQKFLKSFEQIVLVGSSPAK